MRHVVGGIAGVGEREPAQLLLVLTDREQVGEDLARVELVGQRVDDRHAAVCGHLFDAVLAEGAPHDRGDLPGDDARDVGDRLAFADAGQARVDGERLAAEFGDAARERQLGAQCRLVEDECNGLRSVQRLVAVPVGLHLGGEVEHLREFVRRQVVVAEEVPDHALRQCVDENRQRLVDVCLGEDQRRGEPDRVRTDGVDQQAASASRGFDCGGLVIGERECAPQAARRAARARAGCRCSRVRRRGARRPA